MKINNISLSVVIPVYNEEKMVGRVISDLRNQLEATGIIYEIIAVNDYSTDSSQEILKNIVGISLINHAVNKGYGASLKTGLRNSQYDWTMIIDADGTYPTTAIPELLKNAGRYELVIGSREKKENAIPAERRLAKKFLNKFASYLAGHKIPDLNSGLRIFRKEIVLKYWELFPERFSFTSTLTMTCLVHNYDTIFVPIDYYKREGKSSIRPKDFFNFLRLVSKLSLFFKPIKIFAPISVALFLIALGLMLAYILGFIATFFDTIFIVLCATALQTFFFGLLAEIIIHNKR